MQSERPCSIVQSVVERLCFPPLVILNFNTFFLLLMILILHLDLFAWSKIYELF
jgi:hypothetical protein